jgi:outer membrane protein assembly factor BamB
MASAYLTSMGALWSGWGINVNAVQPGGDGWVYLGGIEMRSPNALVVLSYQNGQFKWEKKFPEGPGFGSFEALAYSNGKLYAA